MLLEVTSNFYYMYLATYSSIHINVNFNGAAIQKLLGVQPVHCTGIAIATDIIFQALLLSLTEWLQ